MTPPQASRTHNYAYPPIGLHTHGVFVRLRRGGGLVALAGGELDQLLVADLLAGGAPVTVARLAALVVSAVEGAIVLSRAERDSAPLLDVADELEAVLRSALPASRLEAESPNDA